MLVDAGAASANWNAGRDAVIPFLRERGVGALDRVVISHGDGDHWGGLEAIADEVRIGELVLPADSPLGPMDDLVSRLADRGTPIRWVTAGDTLPPLGRLECVVQHPCRDFEKRWGAQLGEELNDRSIVLKATYGNAEFLLAGDIERAAEHWLVVDSRAMECTVLKVPHHGSDTSSSLEFLHLVSPAIAVISCGPRRRFNLPKPEILARYDSLGVHTMITARAGAVIVTTDGRRLHVRSYLDAAGAVELDL
jgi:competence protein ComEC